MSSQLLLAALAGFAVSAVSTPVGVSGAVLLLPAQMSVLGLTGPAVSATNLLFNAISTPSGLWRLTRRHRAPSADVGVVVLASVPAVVLGAFLRVTVLADPTRFRLAIAVFLLPLGVRLLIRVARGEPAKTSTEDGTEARNGMALLGFLAFCTGIVGGLLGIGGGSLLAPALLLLTARDSRAAAVLALTATLTTSVSGLVAYSVLDLADIGASPAAPFWAVGVALGIGGIAGSLLGASVAHRMSDRLLLSILGIVVTLTAVLYVVQQVH